MLDYATGKAVVSNFDLNPGRKTLQPDVAYLAGDTLFMAARGPKPVSAVKAQVLLGCLLCQPNRTKRVPYFNKQCRTSCPMRRRACSSLALRSVLILRSLRRYVYFCTHFTEFLRCIITRLLSHHSSTELPPDRFGALHHPLGCAR